MSHIQMCHVTRLNESRHTYEWVFSHIWGDVHSTRINPTVMSPVNESRDTLYAWVKAHSVYMSHGMNESRDTYEWGCLTCEWVVTHIWVSHVTHMTESNYTHVWDMSHAWSDVYSGWLDATAVSHVNYSLNTHERVMAHIWMNHGTHIWSMDKATASATYEWVRHRYEWDMANIWTSHGTHMNESWHTCEAQG